MTVPLSLPAAQALLLDPVMPLPAEPIAAADAAGRYLAAGVTARRTQPAADLSAMDGYAMRADDLAGPWTITGESAAGHPFQGNVRPGEAVRVSTGSLVPHDAGAVLLQEDATRDGERVSLSGGGSPSPRHIRRAGFDFRAGDVLLEAGTRMGPAQIALALSGSNADLQVHALPSVWVIDSGDELTADPTVSAPHQIPASNGAMLSAMVAPFVRSVQRIGPVADRLADLTAAFAKAGSADVIVTSGGASLGDHDLIRPALEAWGAKISFWRVAMRPGKPLLVARKGGATVVGLPGNPVSSYVTAFFFVLPLLRRLAGAREPLPIAVAGKLARALPAGGARTEFVRASLAGEWVTPLGEQDSSALRTLAAADALIERPAGAAAADAGSVVPVYRLENGGAA